MVHATCPLLRVTLLISAYALLLQAAFIPAVSAANTFTLDRGTPSVDSMNLEVASNFPEFVPIDASTLPKDSSPEDDNTPEQLVELYRNSPIRTDVGNSFSLNKHHGISLLLLATVLWFVNYALKSDSAVKELQSLNESAPPHASSLSFTAHVLNNPREHSLLVLFAQLPLWQPPALVGALRVLASIASFVKRRHNIPGCSPVLSGVLETLVGLFIFLGQEAPGDLARQILGSDRVSSFAPGLLLAGLVLLLLSFYRVTQWRRRHGKARQVNMPTLQLERPAVMNGSNTEQESGQ